jgi:hypothetical protein
MQVLRLAGSDGTRISKARAPDAWRKGEIGSKIMFWSIVAGHDFH